MQQHIEAIQYELLFTVFIAQHRKYCQQGRGIKAGRDKQLLFGVNRGAGSVGPEGQPERQDPGSQGHQKEVYGLNALNHLSKIGKQK